MDSTDPTAATKEPGTIQKFLNSVLPGKRLSRPSSRNASPSPSMKGRSASEQSPALSPTTAAQQQADIFGPSSSKSPISQPPAGNTDEGLSKAVTGTSNLPSRDISRPAPVTTSSGAPLAGAGVAAAGPNSPQDLHHYASQSSLPSPASSQIFERSVQEPMPLANHDPTASSHSQIGPDGNPLTTLPSAIPTHVMTEDHIPAALDASSIAITQKGLDTDDVAVLTSKGHLPAVEAVASSLDIPLSSSGTSTTGLHRTASSEALGNSPVGSTGTSPTRAQVPPPHHQQQHHQHDRGSPSMAPTQPHIMTATSPNPVPTSTSSSSPTSISGAATAGLSKSDPRRLSFISFADVMHAEHVEHDLSHSQPNLLDGTAAGNTSQNPQAPLPGSLSPPQQHQHSPSGTAGGKRSTSPAASLRKGAVGVSTGSPLVNATSVDEFGPTSPSSLSGIALTNTGSNGNGSTLSPPLGVQGSPNLGPTTTTTGSAGSGAMAGRSRRDGSPLASRSASRNRSRAASGTGLGLGMGGLGEGTEGGEVQVQSLTDVVRGGAPGSGSGEGGL